MSSFNFCLKIVRPQHMLLAAISTWVIAMLSNGQHYFTTAKLASPIVMALSVMGASLYHFGAANPMYTRKSETLSVRPTVRIALIAFGLAILIGAVYMSSAYLNPACRRIVSIDAIIIVAYAGILSRHWLTKNLLIAFVCASPVLMGWFAGDRLHPAVPYGITVTFFAYLAREIVKDVQDRKANHGYRHTLPLWLGLVPARRIAATVLIVALTTMVIFGFKLLDYNIYALAPCFLAGGYFLAASHSLAFRRPGTEIAESKQILIGSFWLMLTFLFLIF